MHENKGFRTFRVSSVEPLHAEAVLFDQGVCRAVKVTIPSTTLPGRRDPALPAPDAWVRRCSMLDEAEDAIRLENAPDLGQHAHSGLRGQPFQRYADSHSGVRGQSSRGMLSV
ncbi:MAG: hypothetical protein RIG93_31885 [Roseibium album]|uniref:hypothetical protein n=1 Tax=Roseibium album TaxID=311410 RepID=UPI0032ECD4B9